MAKGDEPLTVQDVVAASRRRTGKGGPLHSPLYEWLWSHHGVLAPELNPPRTPNWHEMAATFAEKGLLDARGQTPKGLTVRRTWQAVERDKGIAAGGTVRKPKRGRTTPAEATPAPEPPTNAPIDPENPYGFRTMGGVKSPPKKEDQ